MFGHKNTGIVCQRAFNPISWVSTSCPPIVVQAITKILRLARLPDVEPRWDWMLVSLITCVSCLEVSNDTNMECNSRRLCAVRQNENTKI